MQIRLDIPPRLTFQLTTCERCGRKEQIHTADIVKICTSCDFGIFLQELDAAEKSNNNK